MIGAGDFRDWVSDFLFAVENQVGIPLFATVFIPRVDESVKIFLSIGLDEKTAITTINNPKVNANLTAVIHEAGVTDGCDRTMEIVHVLERNLSRLYVKHVATKYHSNLFVHRSTLFKYIVSSKIKTPAQLEAAVSCFDSNAPEDFKLSEFEEACGVDEIFTIVGINSCLCVLLFILYSILWKQPHKV